MVAFFETQLIVLGAFTSILAAASRIRSRSNAVSDEHTAATSKLATDYLTAYCLLIAGDWLQGPYMFRLLVDEHHFAIQAVATLFVIGFLSAAVASPIVGRLADRYGRRMMNLVYCLLYSISCLLLCLPSWTACVLARILGGIATSIAFSTQESWLVSTSHSLGLPQASLSSIFGHAAFLNGVVAVVSGIVSNSLVNWTGTAKTPFRLAVGVLALAAVTIRSRWSENYGSQTASPAADVKNAMRTIMTDASLFTVLFSQTMFETSMYLFVFLWVPAMQDSAAAVSYHLSGDLPLGIIFAAFMSAMMLGSLLYSYVVKHSSPAAALPPTDEQAQLISHDRPLVLHGKLAGSLLLTAALGLALANIVETIEYRFWAFCLFEMTVGIYFPVLGWLKSELVRDEVRATFASLFRLPLNILVTCALLFGAESRRKEVFLASTLALTMASCLANWFLVLRQSNSSPRIGLKM